MVVSRGTIIALIDQFFDRRKLTLWFLLAIPLLSARVSILVVPRLETCTISNNPRCLDSKNLYLSKQPSSEFSIRVLTLNVCLMSIQICHALSNFLCNSCELLHSLKKKVATQDNLTMSLAVLEVNCTSKDHQELYRSLKSRKYIWDKNINNRQRI